MAKPVYTDSQVISQLNSGYQWTGSTITYGFPTTFSWFPYGEATGASGLSAAQQSQATLALKLWDDLIAPNMTAAADPTRANIRISNTTTNISYAHAYYPGSYTGAGSVWFNPGYGGTNNLNPPTIGQWGWVTYIHEIGHALGLSHPGAYNGGSPTYANDAVYYQDSQQYTVMSYFTADNTGADWVASDGRTYYAQTPMLDDVLAIQAIYGADTTTRTGNTTYGFNANVDRVVFDFVQNPHPIVTIYDAGGIDTLDLSGFSSPSRIDLNPGTYSDADMMTMNIAIARNTWIENAVGGSGNDVFIGNVLANTLTGNAGNDTFTGGGGNDRIYGGAGTDTAIYSGSYYSYSISWNATEAAYVLVDNRTGAPDGTDMVWDVEFFQFADGTWAASNLVPTGSTSYSIAATDAIKAEGASGSTPFVFTVTRSGSTSAAGTVNWAVTGSGANPANADDFVGGVLPSGTLSFDAGETSKTITVNVLGDGSYEADEGFSVSLSAPSNGAAIGIGTASGTILNDDAAPLPTTLSIAATDATKAEGDSGMIAFSFTVTRSGDTTLSTSANYAVSGSGANPASASDFFGGALPTGTVTFNPGETSKVITVNVAGDGQVEADEGFTVTLSAPSNGATLGTASAVGTILNDDTGYAIAATSAVKQEGAAGTTTAYIFTVTRTGNTASAATLNWSVAGAGANGATAEDFAGGVLPAGTISFAAGETSKTITVNVAGDNLVEPDEGFVVNLTLPTAAVAAVEESAIGGRGPGGTGASAGGGRGKGPAGPARADDWDIAPAGGPSGISSLAVASATGTILNDDFEAQSNIGTPGNDVIDRSAATSGQVIDVSQGGDDTVTGGSGDDIFLFGAAFTAADKVNGGAGNDTLVLSGAYAGGVSFNSTTLTNVELIVLGAGNNYNLTLNDATTANGASLTIDASALAAVNSATVNGAAEKSASLVFLGGAGKDNFTGGAGNDRFLGGAGADVMVGGRGADTFIYLAASDSPYATVNGVMSLAGSDLISGFQVSIDMIDLSAFGFSGSQAAVLTKSVTGFSTGDVAGFFGTAGVAVEYARSGGTAQLYVDANKDGNLGSNDMVIQLTGVAKGSIGASSIVF